MIEKFFRKIMEVILTRSMVFFVLCLAISGIWVNQSRLKMGERVRVAHYQSPDTFKELAEFVAMEKDIPFEKLNELISYYTLYLEKNPKDADAYNMLGFCYYHLKNVEEAIVSYRKAIELNPDFLWTYYNLGVIYFYRGNYDEARAWLDKGVLVDPEKSYNVVKSSRKVFLPVLSAAMIQGGDLKRRIKTVYRDSYLLLVLNCYRLKEFVPMQVYAGRAITANLGYKALFYYYQGLSLYELKDYAKASSAFEESVKYNQSDERVFYSLGLSLKALGKNQEAEDFLRKAESIKAMKNGPDFYEDKIAVRIF